MDRRRFIGTSAAGGMGLTLGTGCMPSDDGRGSDAAPGYIRPFELDGVEVAELQRGMEAGERTARSITEAYLERIGALNLEGPELRAIIETNPDALGIADTLDAERRARGPRGPLHGIPVVLKDNIGTRDAMTTTAGSLALEGSLAPRDAFIVERLRQAGAVVLAKANMSEWANFRSTRSTSGWSARGGQCRNPHALDRSPCGSSSGSAVAAAASLAALTIGTETNGSIMCPASVSGVVGLKPTVGLWSRSEIIPISHSQDTPGPICRTVRDAATLLGPLAGVDARDEATARSPGNSHGDYTQFLDVAGLRGARLGVARSFTGSHPGVYALFDEAIEAMRAEGAVLVDPVELDRAAYDNVLEVVVLEHEFKAGLNAYLAGLGPGAPVKSLAEIIDFNERNADREMPFFGQDLMHASEERGALTDPAYLRAFTTIRSGSREAIDGVLRQHELDAIIAPTAPLAWLTDHVQGDRPGGGHSAGPAAVAGYPSITVPMGFVSGLPAGISFFGTAWSEPTLLRVAYAYEQVSRQRRPPAFLATVG